MNSQEVSSERNILNKLIKNWAYLLVSDISQSVISFFVFMLLARKLSPEGYGTLNVILALASLFAVFSINFSSNQVVIREVTLHPGSTKQVVKKVTIVRVLSLVITIMALLVYMFYTGETRTLHIAAISIIIAATLGWDLAESIAFGHFVTKLTTFISISGGIAWFLIIFFLPAAFVNVEIVLMIYAAIFLIRSLVYLGFSFKKYVGVNLESAKISFKSILLMSMPFLWIRIMGTFGDQIPILLLRGNSGNTEVGYYALGNRFIMPITIAVSTGLRAMFPFMTKLFQEDKASFNRKLADGFSSVLILGSSIAMLLTITSSIWIPLLFGEAYIKSILPFNYQAWFGVLMCFDMLLANVLAATYRQNALAIIMSVDVLIIFPLMYLGSAHGAEGMAIAKLAGTFLTIVYHVVVVVVMLKARLKSFSFFLSAFYFTVMMVVTIFIPDTGLKILLISILVISFLLYRNSPLREMSRLLYHRLAKQA